MMQLQGATPVRTTVQASPGRGNRRTVPATAWGSRSPLGGSLNTPAGAATSSASSVNFPAGAATLTQSYEPAPGAGVHHGTHIGHMPPMHPAHVQLAMQQPGSAQRSGSVGPGGGARPEGQRQVWHFGPGTATEYHDPSHMATRPWQDGAMQAVSPTGVPVRQHYPRSGSNMRCSSHGPAIPASAGAGTIPQESQPGISTPLMPRGGSLAATVGRAPTSGSFQPQPVARDAKLSAGTTLAAAAAAAAAAHAAQAAQAGLSLPGSQASSLPSSQVTQPSDDVAIRVGSSVQASPPSSDSVAHAPENPNSLTPVRQVPNSPRPPRDSKGPQTPVPVHVVPKMASFHEDGGKKVLQNVERGMTNVERGVMSIESWIKGERELVEKAKIECLELSVQQKQEAIANLEAKLEQERNAREQLQARLADLEARAKESESRAVQAESSASWAESRAVQAESRASEAEAKFADREDRLSTTELRLAQAESRASQKTADELAKAKKQQHLSQQETATMERRLAAVQRELEEKNKLCRDLDEKMRQEAHDAARWKADCERFAKEQSQTQALVQNLQSDNSRQDERRRELEKSTAEFARREQELSQKARSMAEKEQQFRAREEEWAQREKQVATREQQFRGRDEELTQLETMLKQERQELQAQQAEMERQLTRQQQDLVKQVEDLQTQSKKSSGADKENRQLKNTVQQQKKQLWDLEGQLNREKLVANFLTPGEYTKMVKQTLKDVKEADLLEQVRDFRCQAANWKFEAVENRKLLEVCMRNMTREQYDRAEADFRKNCPEEVDEYMQMTDTWC
eukprot:TRINITY_DN13397_c0_g1_i1.p1 TRINITY_DN13397_c0_g1~~TRINITY_DN13397_c0_g1_i1.p1  ORF type:complete len:802 (-),score=240.85 TRINITY_DN13397_c0_g1_i1:366-2771(-)